MDEIISMSYGSGGKKTSDLIENMILPKLHNPKLNLLGDGAMLNVKDEICFSTDSFVIDPYFFPGGDIGKLSICGTVNDLIMCGAVPKYLSLSFILEEGFKTSELETIVKSIADTAAKAGVQIVTGDTKVVDKGHGGGIYINTAGIGEHIKGLNLGKNRLEKGDKVIVTGNVGDHGVSILCTRENLLEESILSDCMPLYELLELIQQYKEYIKILRDPTRGGVATTLNEFVEGTKYSIELDEQSIPLDPKVKSACDLLGLDPMYSANEGKALIVIKGEKYEEFLRDLRAIESFKDANGIGEIIEDETSRVYLRNFLGARRILDKLSTDILPRIC